MKNDDKAPALLGDVLRESLKRTEICPMHDSKSDLIEHGKMSPCTDCGGDTWVGPRCEPCNQKAGIRTHNLRESGVLDTLHYQLGEEGKAPTVRDWEEGVPEGNRSANFAMAASKAKLAARGDLRMLVLLGPRGTGKTQLAVCAICDGIRKGRSGLIVSTWDCLCEIRANRALSAAREKQRAPRHRFVAPALLVLDEFQVRGGGKWEAAELVTLVDERYRTPGKVTIMCANLEPDAFADYAGDSIVSRIKELGGKVVCGWPSFRGQP